MSDKSTTCDAESFVYDNKEYIKTGRVAQRAKIIKRRGKSEKVITRKIEICPVSMTGKNTTSSNMYNIWVNESEIFHIED